MNPRDALEQIMRAHIVVNPFIKNEDGSLHKEIEFREEFECLLKVIKLIETISRFGELSASPLGYDFIYHLKFDEYLDENEYNILKELKNE